AVSPAAASSLRVSVAPITTAGSAISITVTAWDAYGNPGADYQGTIGFTSSDAQATLPADYTFTSLDGGHHSVTATFKTAGTQSLVAADAAVPGVAGSQAGIAVSPAAASSLRVAGLPSAVTAGAAGVVTVTALDPYGNTAAGYSGAVHFASSDAQAAL